MAKRPVRPVTRPGRSGRSPAGRSVIVSLSQPCETDSLDAAMLQALEDIKDLLENPVPTGIELGSIEVGCIPDADGNAIGKVYMCIVKDEADTTTTTELKAINFADGSIVAPYTGPIAACSTGNCPDESPLGVITDLSQL